MSVRRLPEVENRVETGAVQFGDDWPGLFVRGDDCFALALAWYTLLRYCPEVPRPWDITVKPLRALFETIADDVDCGDTVRQLLNQSEPEAQGEEADTP